MARSLTEIADQLEAFHESMQIISKAIGGPNGGYGVNDAKGNPIDLVSLAADLREHARQS